MTCESSAVLTEMANRIVTADAKAGTSTLPDDCAHFLHFLETADKHSNAPNFFDQNAWQALCKMRRQRIENEFRVNIYIRFGVEEEGKYSNFNQLLT